MDTDFLKTLVKAVLAKSLKLRDYLMEFNMLLKWSISHLMIHIKQGSCTEKFELIVNCLTWKTIYLPQG